MIRALIVKELHDHLLSLRFQAGFLLALALVSASAFVLSGAHRRESREIFERVRQENDFTSKYSHLNRIRYVLGLNMTRPPAPLVLVRGLPNEIEAEALDTNPSVELFTPVDFTSIVAVIFSLFGIVLGFDAINGERERGTLRLVLANRLRRFDVLAAKWSAGMIVLFLALMAALLAGAAILFALAGVRWSAGDWLSFAAVGGFAFLYAGAFFSLAVMVSAIARRSSVSVLASVFTWVLLVLVLPNLSPYVAAQFARIPSRAALERDGQYVLSEERDQIGGALEQKVRQKYGETGRLPSEEVKRRLPADPAFRKVWEQMRDEIQAAWDEANRRQGAKARRMAEAWNARTEAQFRLSRKLSYASPVPPFVYAATELADTGFTSRERLEKQVMAFMNGPLNAYLEQRFREERRKNPRFGVNDFLDIAGRPRFVYTPPPLRDRLAACSSYAGMLAGWNLAFLVGALLAFLRFDVR